MLFLPPVLPNVDDRCTVENGASARFVPDEERAKTGCAGRPGARDILEDCAWTAVYGACGCAEFEFDRFMADIGIGMADTLVLRGPSVCVLC
jgi:hypothetical protein